MPNRLLYFKRFMLFHETIELFKVNNLLVIYIASFIHGISMFLCNCCSQQRSEYTQLIPWWMLITGVIIWHGQDGAILPSRDHSPCPARELLPRKLNNKSFIDQAFSVKMAGYWPGFFASLWISTPSRSINMQKKNLANIQPS